ncbi:amino acid adenylation domain-containing protein [Streptomyces sp. NBC_00237]|uniref:amino acid adenylation domain-containing protein n=1 Tax=Streptomyces sp. NBC_00237 TaxID=2975687 RepID=UPI0022557821|nr:amino acid adenylation domain-containing protein [Streptomyces sp. NBC_00237]MCX5202987.1 amino acid adenylation domain-containing protein [Streptomyces sp. NBC_00237]
MTTAPAATGPKPATGPLPATGLKLTAAQSGMWFAQALDPASPAQNTAECLEIHGPIDPETFARTLRQVVSETDALRVRIVEDSDGPRQLEISDLQLPLHVADLRTSANPFSEAYAWMHADLAVPFDLAEGPLFAHALFRVGDDRWLWYQRVHHIVMDGFGYSLLARRTAEVYTALASGDTPPDSPFARLADLVDEDAGYRVSETYDKDRRHWDGAFADRPEAPTLAGRTALPSRTFHRRSARLSPLATDQLREVASSIKATWPEVLIAAQALYVSRATHTEEVVLGLPMMGRMGSVALRVPGMVMNVLPLRLTVTPQATFAELTRQVVLGIRSARRHQRYRYEDIRRDLGLLGEGRSLVGPLVNVMPFDYGLTFAGARTEAHNLSAGPVEDLTVNVYDRTDGSGLRIDYDGNPALYEPHELALHQSRFLELLERVAGSGPHTPLAAHTIARDTELTLVRDEFNTTDHPVPATTLIGPIEEQAARTPDAPALVFGDEQLTYAELNARANRLAHHLIESGVRPGALAAVAVPRSLDLVVALLAVLKAGGAYLPLDPDYPADRLSSMLADAEPACVIADRADRVPASGTPVVTLDGLDTTPYSTGNPTPGVTPQDPAYVIYTSGSTGRPKGVVVGHAAIDNRLRWMQATYELTPGDRVLQKTPSGFDVSVWEFFWALRVGATLVVAEPGGHKDPAYLARVIREQAVTACHFVPSMLQVFLTEPAASECTGLRHVFASGEALPRETVREFGRVLGGGVPLHNLYGPTEAAVDVTYHPCDTTGTGTVPIGRPVWNTRLYVLDAALQPCPPGVSGELFLAGVQLADGYLGRPALTASRFVADPYGLPGSRMYRTGDLARWTVSGEIEYLGRTDHQVKLRGQRIELGEIEAELANDPTVGASGVLVREDRPGDQRLVGYVTPAAGAERPAPEALRARLARTLPEHMVPGAILVLDDFPLSPNGKLDRKALPAPEFSTTADGGRVPANHREETLTRLFAEILGVPRVGVDDAFFDLGGTSLLAARLVARVRDTLGAELTIGTLFQAQTPASLAAQLDAGNTDSDHALDTLLPLRATGERTPLFAFHPAGGISWCYSGLLSRLDTRQPVYGLQARGLHGDGERLPATMEEMAADYIEAMRTVRPHGPYRLIGWSVGGVLAHTVAVRLQEAGEQVELLALMDAYPSDQWQDSAIPAEADALTALLRMAGYDRTDELTREDVLATLHREGSALAGLPDRTLSAVVDIVVNNARLMRAHRHRPFTGDVLFFTAAAPREESWLTPDAWAPYLTGRLVNDEIDCLHPELTQPGPLDEVCAVLADRLKELDHA